MFLLIPAITVCHPNPCFHGGVCHSLNNTNYWCHCANTAYMGGRCHVGIFRTPKFPRLEQNDSFNVTFKVSPPADMLTIKPSATGLEFHPQDIVITPVRLKQGRLLLTNMTITARVPGIHQITYTLSGLVAKSYQAVLPDTVIVLENGTSCNDTFKTSFPVGCHKIRLLRCPKTSNFLFVSSTESWQRSQSRVVTKGVATILSGSLKLPLGIRGATLDKMNFSSVSTGKTQCQTGSSKHTQCLASEALATAFLQSLNGSFPSWFRMIPSKTLSSLAPNDIITYIWTGTELEGILKGLGLSLNDKSYYSVLIYTGAITVEVNESSVFLPKYDRNSFLLVAVELCPQASQTKVIVTFNPLSYDALKNMTVYRQLATHGWNISVLAVQFSRNGGLNYSANSWMKRKTIIPGNIELYGRIEKSIDGSQEIRSLRVRLVGNAITEIPDTDKVSQIRIDPFTASDAILVGGQKTFAFKKIGAELRTVPTFVTAHTFCASRDTWVSYGWCPLIQGYFCAF